MTEKNITKLERFDFQDLMESKNLPIIIMVTRRNAKLNLSSLKKQTQQ